MVIDYFLKWKIKVFGKPVKFRKCGQIAIVIRGIHFFQYRMVVAQFLNDIFYEIFMVHQIITTKMIDPLLISIDEVMNLLGQSINGRDVNDDVWKIAEIFDNPTKSDGKMPLEIKKASITML